MIVVGLALVVIAVAVAVILITNGGQTVSMNFAGVSLDTTASWFFVAGLVVAAIAMLGVWCVRFGTRRTIRARKQNRALRKEAEAGREARAEREAEVESHKSTGQRGRAHRDGDGGADSHFDSAPRE